ncbi:MAG: hypothetical protein WAR37_04860 [Candidatus Microsaccharimonas sp.]
MATIVERAKSLGLPLDNFVVIGSGLLDALGLRKSGDIDIAVSPETWQRLADTNRYRRQLKHDGEVLLSEDLEIWPFWTPEHPFSELYASAVKIDGVLFANPAIIIEFKKWRASEKDLKDIVLLEGHLNERA